MEDSGFRVKAEEFVMLSQEPSPSETISPKVARPFIEALKSTEREEEEKEEQEEMEEDEENEEWNVLDGESESAWKPLVSELGKAQYLEHPSLLQELVAVVDQAEVRTAKRKWETQHLKGLRAEEEKMFLQGKEEELFTYTREDAYSKVNKFLGFFPPPRSSGNISRLGLACASLSQSPPTVFSP
ncbi:E1A-binding protein [Ophiophagus hannah]|uniref:E1A-binding protein n=1 Tax=Ophiophagus hannah TaxID=8665 RepID=V8NC82_OPHHA|nr:E1A-binding protein [Ophiophagus hannah]